MEFLNKIEIFLNKLLLKLADWFIQTLHKKLPKKIFELWDRFDAFRADFKIKIKNLPALIKEWAIKKIKGLKEYASTFNFKAKFQESYKAAMAKYAEQKDLKEGRIKNLKKILLAPFLLMGQWVRGLTVLQSMMLMGFTGASFLAVIGFIFSGQRLVNHYANRTPASVEAITYDRPDYYKQDSRHIIVTNFRIPVYVAEVNEIKSVDIDFIAQISNRNARNFLDKNEFQLRDHIISHFEPSIASFPLEEEGKKIIKEKLLIELNEFIKQYGQEGFVENLKITYILAN